MKIKRFVNQNGWIVQLEYCGIVYQGEGKTLKQAMRQAFSTLDI